MELICLIDYKTSEEHCNILKDNYEHTKRKYPDVNFAVKVSNYNR